MEMCAISGRPVVSSFDKLNATRRLLMILKRFHLPSYLIPFHFISSHLVLDNNIIQRNFTTISLNYHFAKDYLNVKLDDNLQHPLNLRQLIV